MLKEESVVWKGEIFDEWEFDFPITVSGRSSCLPACQPRSLAVRAGVSLASNDQPLCILLLLLLRVEVSLLPCTSKGERCWRRRFLPWGRDELLDI